MAPSSDCNLDERLRGHPVFPGQCLTDEQACAHELDRRHRRMAHYLAILEWQEQHPLSVQVNSAHHNSGLISESSPKLLTLDAPPCTEINLSMLHPPLAFQWSLSLWLPIVLLLVSSVM